MPCGGCGKHLLTLPTRRCDACKRATRRRRKYEERARRAAHLSIAIVEHFTLEDIAERDKYRCGLCKKRVDMTLKVPEFMAPTLDHVLPVAMGGDHTRANAQLAHFICNSSKSDGGSQQLALVG